jgi:hypothetical protein
LIDEKEKTAVQGGGKDHMAMNNIQHSKIMQTSYFLKKSSIQASKRQTKMLLFYTRSY